MSGMAVDNQSRAVAVNVLCLYLLVELWYLEGASSMVRDDDAGPFVNNWDEEESGAQDWHQQEGPQKHSIQNLGYKLPVLYHLSDLIFFNYVHGYVADRIQSCL